MSLEFGYLPPIPRDKIALYHKLETAFHSLLDHLKDLSLTEAQADDGLAQMLIDFWTALEAAQQALSENEPVLSDTLYDLRRSREPEGEFATNFLICGNITRFPGLSGEALIERIRKLVRDVLDGLHHFGEPNKKWHYMKKRIAEYCDALLGAIKPVGRTGEAKGKPNGNDPRDKLCYTALKKGKTLKWIRDEVNKHEQWEPLTTPLGVSQAAKRYAERKGLA